MFEGQISESLRLRLAGKVRGIGTAIPTTHGKKTGERGLNALRPQLPAGEESSGIRLVWSQEATTAMRKTAGRKTDAAAFLMIEGGKL